MKSFTKNLIRQIIRQKRIATEEVNQTTISSVIKDVICDDKLSDSEAMELLNQTQLVDKEFYWTKYEDVKRRGVDPVSHFVRFGHKENRMPNEYFDTALYRSMHNIGQEVNPLLDYYLNKENHLRRTSEYFDGRMYYHLHNDVMKAQINPLEHYLKHGHKENRAITINNSLGAKVVDKIVPYSIISKCISSVKLTIIIPVYNAVEEVVNCLDSVILNTSLGNNISVLVLNDCSPDPNVAIELDKYSAVYGIKVAHNKNNLGYTGNVNKGVEVAGESDVILLNSDTIVSPNWCRNLIVAAYSNDDIATVTAVSNNAGAFSVPQPGTNIIDENLSIKGVARLINNVAPDALIDVPTGNGFCLYIKRDALNDIGYFDIESYPKGYGEENDYCMRAVAKGWVNVVDPKTYIYHVRSASFKDSKQALIESGVEQVKKTYPNYEGAIKAIGQSELMKEARETIAIELDKVKADNSLLKPKIMFVISTRTGGTPQTNFDLMRGLSDIYDCYVLACNGQLVEILRAGKNGYEQVEKFELKQKVTFATHRSYDYEKLVKSLLVKYNIDLLHIRHIAWHSLKLPQIAKELYIPVVKSFHDFYAVCPSINLISEKGKLTLSGVVEDAPNLLWRDETVKPMNENMLTMWQKRMQSSLAFCDHYITTCQSGKDILIDSLGKLDEFGKKFTVIPHGRNFDSFVQPKDENLPTDILKVLLPGNISLSKGKELILKVIELDTQNKIEFHVLGTCDEDLKSHVVFHGGYNREDFQQRVVGISPHISAVFSIWPETYCHTLTESWASGIPVMGLAYGAVEKRIARHGGGWLVENDAQKCFEKLISLLNNQVEFKEKNQEINNWQTGYGQENTVERMTGQYISIYQQLLSKQESAKLPEKRKLGFVLKGIFPNVPPTAYVRLVDWKEEFEQNSGLEVEFISWQTLVTSDIQEYQEFVIQRDAIPGHAVDWCLDALSRYDITYTYEIDDNLLDVPVSVDPEGVYSAYRPKLEKLITNASLVHVTNNALASVCKKYNENILIRPNDVFAHRWNMDFPEKEKIELNLPENKTHILYFGSRTHQEDLDFLLDVVKEANANGGRFHLSIVGCGDIPDKYQNITTRLVPPDSRYDFFVNWLTKISHNFDLGVAPLVNLKFSQSKSSLKVLELTSLNLPVVCSNNLPYSALKGLKQYQCKGILYIDNNINDWCRAIMKTVTRGSVK
ncbi:glycosyltransferase [Vibrio sp. 10N.222.51.C5]|uniref:glycosyltransferase n=1 Tax=Vibrio sp. 10N.222.51.C5 TaxID=3229623 RepID=UPI00354B30B5